LILIRLDCYSIDHRNFIKRSFPNEVSQHGMEVIAFL